jgi:hypothetical protein
MCFAFRQDWLCDLMAFFNCDGAKNNRLAGVLSVPERTILVIPL